MIPKLTAIDISDKEFTIYKHLLQLGPSSIRSLASISNINRGTTYELLKTLVKKGLVSYAPKGKRKYFAAQNPYQLLLTAEDKRKNIDETIKILKNEIIPSLEHIKYTDEVADIRYYEGDDGIEKILRDVLNTSKAMYRVYSSRPVRKYLYRNFPEFTTQRIKKKLFVRVIAIGKGGKETKYSQRKWIDTKSKSSASSYSIIYPPKYALISVTNEQYPYGIIIHEESMAITQKIIFDSLWNKL